MECKARGVVSMSQSTNLGKYGMNIVHLFSTIGGRVHHWRESATYYVTFSTTGGRVLHTMSHSAPLEGECYILSHSAPLEGECYILCHIQHHRRESATYYVTFSTTGGRVLQQNMSHLAPLEGECYRMSHLAPLGGECCRLYHILLLTIFKWNWL